MGDAETHSAYAERDPVDPPRAVVGRVARIARELHMLHHQIEDWDGEHPLVQHLTERLEGVEADLLRLEAEIRALRTRPSD